MDLHLEVGLLRFFLTEKKGDDTGVVGFVTDPCVIYKQIKYFIH